MSEQLSEFMDGEQQATIGNAYSNTLKDAGNKNKWNIYHVIRDVMQDAAIPDKHISLTQFHTRFQSQFLNEPNHLSAAHHERNKPAFRRLAIAATLVGVGIFGWFLTTTIFPETPMPVTQNTSTITLQKNITSDYILAHQEYALGSDLQGMTPPYMLTATVVDSAR